MKGWVYLLKSTRPNMDKAEETGSCQTVAWETVKCFVPAHTHGACQSLCTQPHLCSLTFIPGGKVRTHTFPQKLIKRDCWFWHISPHLICLSISGWSVSRPKHYQCIRQFIVHCVVFPALTTLRFLRSACKNLCCIYKVSGYISVSVRKFKTSRHPGGYTTKLRPNSCKYPFYCMCSVNRDRFLL